MNQFEFFAAPQLRDLMTEVNQWIEANGVDINTWDFSRPRNSDGDYLLIVYYSEANPGNPIGFKKSELPELHNWEHVPPNLK